MSCRPGAEGAPREVCAEGVDLVWEEVLVVVVAWVGCGMMRIDDCEERC